MKNAALKIVGFMRRLCLYGRTAALLAVVALCLTAGGKKHEYTVHEKAAYADAATVEFRPARPDDHDQPGRDRL